jgi:hypothetical protein
MPSVAEEGSWTQKRMTGANEGFLRVLGVNSEGGGEFGRFQIMIMATKS